MANFITPTVQLVHPSYIEPGVILQQTQASGAFEVLGGAAPLVRLSNVDRMVYVKRMDIRTKVATGQSAFNSLPSVNIEAHMDGTATYLHRVRQEFDHHDSDMASEWGVSIIEAFRLGMQQAHFQNLRNGLLHGYSPQRGEGLLNAPGATQDTLPVDTAGNSTVVTYDPGEMWSFMLGEIAALKTRTNQVGIGIRVVCLTTQRIVAQLSMRQIVEITQWQRAGAGSRTVAGALADVLALNNDEFEFVADDTLIGAGAGGADAMIFTIPEIETPKGKQFNTNKFAEVAPNLQACNLQFVNSVAPVEFISPIESNRTDFISEMRSTSGWAIRQQATTIASMQYQ